MEPVTDWTSEEVARHEQAMRDIARALVRRHEEIEDLVQDTWLAMLRRPRAGIRDTRSYLKQVARFRALQLARRRHLQTAAEESGAREEALPTADSEAAH